MARYNIVPEKITFAYLRPDLAKEWHPTKNGNLKPTDVSRGSHKKIWWKCKNGHEWQANVYTRDQGSGCPYCSGKRLVRGVNDFATCRPDLVKQWNTEKNGELKPSDCVKTSRRLVWWKCEKGHEWQEEVVARLGSKSDYCPYCRNRKVLAGFNDLATVAPELAKEWHPVKNGDLKPTDVISGTAKKVWWQCEKGHEWCASIRNRHDIGCGCPVCFVNRRWNKNY